MKKPDLDAKNLVQFRLIGTARRTVPDGNLLVSFYHLDTFNQNAVNWHIAGLLVGNRMNAQVLYEGNIQNNTATPAYTLSNGNLQPSGAVGPPMRSMCM
jgi:hypothetical protein